MRKRFISTNGEGFNEHELLELMLFYAIPRVDTNEIAHRLIDTFGSLNAVLEADSSELANVKGVTVSAAKFICFFRECCILCENQSITFPDLSTVQKMCGFFRNYFQASPSHLCLIACLNNSLELTGQFSFTAESILNSKLPMRHLTEILLRLNAERIVLGINRPEKPPVPDAKDYSLINTFSTFFKPIDISLVDCIICSGSEVCSLRKIGAYSFND